MSNRVLKAVGALATMVPTLALGQQRPAQQPAQRPPAQQPAQRPAQRPAAQPAARPTMATRAGAREGTWEFGIGVGAMGLGQAVTGTSSTVVGPGGGVRIGYNVNRSWNIGVGSGGGVGKSSATDRTAYITPFGSITWTPDINQRTSPFITLIGGPLLRKTPSHTGGAAGVGVGLRHMIGEAVALRVEGDVQYARFNGLTSGVGLGTVGLSFFSGARRVVTAVAVTPGSATLASIRATQQLAATARDQRGRPMSGKTFTWRSSNPQVATVSSAGMVTAVGDGSATITAMSEGVSGSANVMVSRTAASVAVAPTTATLNALGATQQLRATANDANNNAIANATFTWTSSDANVATVGSSGMVTAVGNGTARITATSGSRNAVATVTVAQTTASVTVAPATATIVQLGTTTQFSAQAMDASGRPITGKTFTWASDATSTATVSAAGMATGVANGTAHITATADGRSGSATLTVAQPARAVPAVSLPAAGQTMVLRISFAGATSRLAPASNTVLDGIATAIQLTLQSAANARFEVGAYSDNRGAAATLQRMTDQRAQAVMQYLVSRGVPASALTARGYGSASPVAPNTTAAGRAQNRRVELKRM